MDDQVAQHLEPVHELPGGQALHPGHEGVLARLQREPELGQDAGHETDAPGAPGHLGRAAPELEADEVLPRAFAHQRLDGHKMVAEARGQGHVRAREQDVVLHAEVEPADDADFRVGGALVHDGQEAARVHRGRAGPGNGADARPHGLEWRAGDVLQADELALGRGGKGVFQVDDPPLHGRAPSPELAGLALGKVLLAAAKVEHGVHGALVRQTGHVAHGVAVGRAEVRVLGRGQGQGRQVREQLHQPLVHRGALHVRARPLGVDGDRPLRTLRDNALRVVSGVFRVGHGWVRGLRRACQAGHGLPLVGGGQRPAAQDLELAVRRARRITRRRNSRRACRGLDPLEQGRCAQARFQPGRELGQALCVLLAQALALGRGGGIAGAAGPAQAFAVRAQIFPALVAQAGHGQHAHAHGHVDVRDAAHEPAAHGLDRVLSGAGAAVGVFHLAAGHAELGRVDSGEALALAHAAGQNA